MLYNKHNLAVAKIADKNAHREELKSVYFTSNKTVATDAVSLLEVSVDSALKIEEYPKVQGETALRGCKPFLVNAEWLKNKIKLPRKTSLPILENVAVKYIHDNKVEFLMSEDAQIAQIIPIPRIDAKFPYYEGIFPNANVAEITINGEKMAELLKIMSELSRGQAVKIIFHGKDKPVELRAENDAHTQRSRALLMPIRE